MSCCLSMKLLTAHLLTAPLHTADLILATNNCHRACIVITSVFAHLAHWNSAIVLQFIVKKMFYTCFFKLNIQKTLLVRGGNYIWIACLVMLMDFSFDIWTGLRIIDYNLVNHFSHCTLRSTRRVYVLSLLLNPHIVMNDYFSWMGSEGLALYKYELKGYSQAFLP